MFDPKLEFGAQLSNEKLRKLFKCSTTGGMRRSIKTNTLVIVSNHYRSIYEDRWTADGVLYYTGTGKKGDQKLKGTQNQTLFDSDTNGVAIHLFEVYGKKGSDYFYRGRVQLAGKPYREDQLDEDKQPRRAWVFPVKLVDHSGPPVVSEVDTTTVRKRQKRVAAKRSDEELLKRVTTGPKKSGLRRSVTTSHTRSEDVAEFTRRRANGICELCSNPAPFQNKKGRPFLEVHHIVWLAKGGDDWIDNTAALCPNCHRRVHILEDSNDVKILLSKRKHD